MPIPETDQTTAEDRGETRKTRFAWKFCQPHPLCDPSLDSLRGSGDANLEALKMDPCTASKTCLGRRRTCRTERKQSEQGQDR